eukprot:TRINITY_DN68013_c8_g10_i1.p1 TRINITY_DN68013_c8_g10~~TRINITY_DN68013_c8_g10_i1.p1  ORF type:complete len:562 (-),score=25.82 TRINITY_DN68013_c8_g10_i1:1325-3010(-)
MSDQMFLLLLIASCWHFVSASMCPTPNFSCPVRSDHRQCEAFCRPAAEIHALSCSSPLVTATPPSYQRTTSPPCKCQTFLQELHSSISNSIALAKVVTTTYQWAQYLMWKTINHLRCFLSNGFAMVCNSALYTMMIIRQQTDNTQQWFQKPYPPSDYLFAEEVLTEESPMRCQRTLQRRFNGRQWRDEYSIGDALVHSFIGVSAVTIVGLTAVQYCQQQLPKLGSSEEENSQPWRYNVMTDDVILLSTRASHQGKTRPPAPPCSATASYPCCGTLKNIGVLSTHHGGRSTNNLDEGIPEIPTSTSSGLPVNSSNENLAAMQPDAFHETCCPTPPQYPNNNTEQARPQPEQRETCDVSSSSNGSFYHIGFPPAPGGVPVGPAHDGEFICRVNNSLSVIVGTPPKAKNTAFLDTESAKSRLPRVTAPVVTPWPYGSVLQLFFTNGSTALRILVLDKIEQLSEYANIAFIATRTRAVADIYVTFDNGRGYSSPLGKTKAGMQPVVTLGFESKGTADPNAIVHTFGRVLGICSAPYIPGVALAAQAMKTAAALYPYDDDESDFEL